MSNHLLVQLLGFAGPCVLLLAVLWIPYMLRRERAHSRKQPTPYEAWRSMSTSAQRAHDNAVLDANEAAEHASARMAEAAKRNALFHP
jgi:hypothetical protein